MAARNVNNHQNHHSAYLQQYLQLHSERSHSASASQRTKNSTKQDSPVRAQTFVKKGSTKSLLSSNSSSPRSSLLESKTNSLRRRQVLPKINNRVVKGSAENLPDEILSAIFWKLSVGEVIIASQVCRRWYKVAGDNLLWKKFYQQFVGPTSKEREDNLPIQELDRGFWKYICLKRCKAKRDHIYLKKWKKPDSYTGLRQRPELSLGKVGTHFELSFNGHSRDETATHTLTHDDLFWMTTSASVRWYGLVFPDISEVTGLKIHACSPLMFHGPTKPAKDGVIQKSLLLSTKINLKDLFKKSTPLGEDEHIQLFDVGKGILAAIYKVDKELAFVVCVLHYDNLVSRCLSGNPERYWSAQQFSAPQDDIDPNYGLHGYSCLLILRNTRQKVLECKFSDLYTRKEGLSGGYAVFSPVRRDDKFTHVTCLKDVSLPWRTSLFKGIVKDVAILDLTVIGEGGELYWAATGFVSFDTHIVQSDQFEFSPEQYRYTIHSDEKGKVEIEIGKLDCGTSYLSRLDIFLSLAAIDKAFHTAYSGSGVEKGASGGRKKTNSAARRPD